MEKVIKLKTKFKVGDKIFWIDYSQLKVRFTTISSIKIPCYFMNKENAPIIDFPEYKFANWAALTTGYIFDEDNDGNPYSWATRKIYSSKSKGEKALKEFIKRRIEFSNQRLIELNKN